jgi:hypothetical protein
VFVARASALIFVTPKSVTNDLTKLNPALQAQLPFGGASLITPHSSGKAPHAKLINTLVVVVKGTNKGLMGVIRDVVGDSVRVELATNNKTVTLGTEYLKRKESLNCPLDQTCMLISTVPKRVRRILWNKSEPVDMGYRRAGDHTPLIETLITQALNL